jgi:hypothetical protein
MPRGRIHLLLYFFFILGARWGSVVNPTPGRFTPETFGTHSIGGWVGFRAGLDRCGKSRPTEIPYPHRPTRSESSNQLRLLGCTIQWEP